jgi:hypothetical protein
MGPVATLKDSQEVLEGLVAVATVGDLRSD